MSDYDTGTPLDEPWLEDEPVLPFDDGALTLTEVLRAQARVWNQYLGHKDQPPGDRGRPWWRASMLGYCLRRQCLWRAGVEATRVESEEQGADKMQKFAWGNDLHAHVVDRTELAGLMIANEVTLHDSELAVHGSIDLLWGGRVQTELPARSRYWDPEYVWTVRELRGQMMEATRDRDLPITVSEIKTVHSYAAKMMHREGPRFDHRMQLAGYALLAYRNPAQLPVAQVPDRYTLLVVPRDAVKPFEFGLPPSDIPEVTERLGLLNDAWATGQWPACTCGLAKGMGWETKFCPYADPDDPGACCGFDLLARLEASLGAVSA